MSKKRVFSTLSLAALLTLSASNGGAELLPTAHAESIQQVNSDLQKADQDNLKGISFILLSIDRRESRRGWDAITVELGIRNNSKKPKKLGQLEDLNGKIHVAEGSPTYDVSLFSASFPKMTSTNDTILPPRMAVCGVLNSPAEIVTPTAVGDIPSTLNPTELEFTDLPKVNLQSKPDRTGCAPTIPSRAQNTPASIELGRPDDPQVAKLSIAGFRPFPDDYVTRLEGRIENNDRFGDLTVDPLNMWMIDRDGVARFSYAEGPYWIPGECNLGMKSEQIIVPPALDSNVGACYPFRPPPDGHPAVAVIQYANDDIPSIVRLADPL